MASREGSQAPTFEVAVPYHHTDADECLSLFGDYGFGFIPAQRHEMEAMLARTEDGRPVAVTIGLSKPRQNGKSFGARMYAVWMACVEGKGVLYSAHLGKTVNEFFKMLLDIFTDRERYGDFCDMLRPGPAGIVRQPGREGFYFTNGGFIEFQTRTNSGARGSSYAVVVIDEAQELTDAQNNALLPTVSAMGVVPQVIMIGTPPDATCAGTVFKRLHAGAHRHAATGSDYSAWWMEWASESLPPRDATRDELLSMAYDCNPMLGHRMTVEAVLNEIDSMSVDGFAHERLGWWSPDDGGYEHVIGSAEWKACLGEPLMEGKVAYGVKFNPNGTNVALCAAVLDRSDPDAPVYVEKVFDSDVTHGTRWLVDWLEAREGEASCFWADGQGRAENLVEALMRRHVSALYCHACNTRDVVRAAAEMQQLVRAREVSHVGQPGLTASVVGASKRPIGKTKPEPDGTKVTDAFGFGDGLDERGEVIDCTLAEAASLAILAVRSSYRDPGGEEMMASW